MQYTCKVQLLLYIAWKNIYLKPSLPEQRLTVAGQDQFSFSMSNWRMGSLIILL